MTPRTIVIAFSVAFGLMGLIFVLLPSATLLFFDWMVYGGYDASPVQTHLNGGETRRYAGFIFQVLGAIILGWAVLLAWVARGPGQLDTAAAHRVAEWGWRGIAISFAAWFVVDTTMSLIMGYWQNAVFNTLFGVAMALPLAAGWPRGGARKPA